MIWFCRPASLSDLAFVFAADRCNASLSDLITALKLAVSLDKVEELVIVMNAHKKDPPESWSEAIKTALDHHL